jgi:hypothetical protein
MSIVFPTAKNRAIEDLPALPKIDMDKLASRISPPLEKTASKKEEACGGVCEPPCQKKPLRKKLVKTEETEKKEKVSYKLSIQDGKVRVPSAALLEKLKDTDPEGFKEALAARDELRNYLRVEASKIDDLRKKQALALRRQNAMEKASQQEEKPVIAKAPQKKVSKVNSKEIIASRLKEYGFSSEAVESYMETLQKKATTNVPEFVEKLAALHVDKEEKTALLKEYIRHEAKLSPEQKNRVLDYWKNELGYPDTAWCEDLVEDVDPVKGK